MVNFIYHAGSIAGLFAWVAIIWHRGKENKHNG